MLAVDVDLALEFGEFAVGSAQELVDRKSNRRTRLIELVSFIGQSHRAQGDGSDCKGYWQFHAVSFALPFASDASVFKSGVRLSGKRPNKLPSSNAGVRDGLEVLILSPDLACTPM